MRKWFKDDRKKSYKTAYYIIKDSKKTDKRLGRCNDLTEEFVQKEISLGCRYCGETELRMTLDRIDNLLGHTYENVVAACIRCNYFRRDMPYAAWYALLPVIRSIRERGLFGDWKAFK